MPNFKRSCFDRIAEPPGQKTMPRDSQGLAEESVAESEGEDGDERSENVALDGSLSHGSIVPCGGFIVDITFRRMEVAARASGRGMSYHVQRLTEFIRMNESSG